MGGIRHTPVDEARTPWPSGAPPAYPSARPRWRGDAAFLVLVVLVATVTFFSLAGASNLATVLSQRARQPSGTPAVTAAPGHPPNGLAASAQPAQVRRFAVPTPNAGLMLPAVDAQGNIWLGEMEINRLARLDPRTGVVTQWQPPNGQYGVMQVVTDAHGTVWFAEEAANYIGNFDPASQTFRTFPVGMARGHIVAPVTVALDRAGNVWFAGENGGLIGRLDPSTGQITTWPVPAGAGGATPVPDTLVLTPSGQVWFGELSGGTIGRLDPATGHFTLYSLPDPKTIIFGMAADTSGHLWFTELQAPALGSLNMATGKITERAVPATVGDPIGLYQIVVTTSGAIWFNSVGANALVRFVPSSGAFTFFQLSVLQSIPYGLTLDASGHLWFSATGAPQNYIGELMVP